MAIKRSDNFKKKISETKKRLYKEGNLINGFKGKKHTEDWITKFTKQNTTIEIKIQEYLKLLGIDFFTQKDAIHPTDELVGFLAKE